MASTDVEVCTEALLLLGADTISSFSDGTDASDICNVLYPTFVRHALASYNWSFATYFAQLSRETTAPTIQWTYQYVIPGESLRIIAVYNSDADNVPPLKFFDIVNDRIHSNETTLYAEYVRYADEADWPSYFTEFAVHAMASKLAVPITDNPELAEYYRQLAYGTTNDNGQGGLYGLAKRIDAQQQPPEKLEQYELISARFG